MGYTLYPVIGISCVLLKDVLPDEPEFSCAHSRAAPIVIVIPEVFVHHKRAHGQAMG